MFLDVYKENSNFSRIAKSNQNCVLSLLVKDKRIYANLTMPKDIFEKCFFVGDLKSKKFIVLFDPNLRIFQIKQGNYGYVVNKVFSTYRIKFSVTPSMKFKFEKRILVIDDVVSVNKTLQFSIAKAEAEFDEQEKLKIDFPFVETETVRHSRRGRPPLNKPEEYPVPPSPDTD